MPRGVKSGKLCRYVYDRWVGGDGRLYVKVTAIEFERATPDLFMLNAQRRARRYFDEQGIDRKAMQPERTGWLEVWDIARDWPSDMPEAMTFRTVVPLPAGVLDAAAA